jgi:hypothetical protein
MSNSIIKSRTLAGLVILNFIFQYCSRKNENEVVHPPSNPIESLPVLNTVSASGITPYSVISGGVINFDGNSSVTAKGVVWSTGPNPTISLSTKTNEGSDSADFVSSITNLNWNTQYYIRSYATNSSGTAYGNEITFTTGKVEVSTSAITNISPTSSLGGGTISGNPGTSLLSKGLVWNTSPNPTVALSTKTNAGGISRLVSESADIS